MVDALKKIDGIKLPTNDVLDLAIQYLGKDYMDMGNGRFLSADGLRQVRMSGDDILGTHGGGPHINLDFLGPNISEPGTLTTILTIHIYFGVP